MSKEMKYECNCGEKWSSEDYDENSTDELESSIAQGLECPKCGGDNVGEEGWKN